MCGIEAQEYSYVKVEFFKNNNENNRVGLIME